MICHVSKKYFSKTELKSKICVNVFCFENKLKILKIQWICCLYLLKIKYIMCTPKIFTDLCLVKQKSQKKLLLQKLLTVL